MTNGIEVYLSTRCSLIGKESEIHYLAPDNLQPDFPFVYLDWNVDYESSDDDRDKFWHSNAHIFWINKTILMQSNFMYTIILQHCH
jgi:hypothetical protein